MKVSELIQLLGFKPQDAMVVARGYESGYNEVTEAEVITVVKMIGNASYDGDYDDSEWTRGLKSSKFEDKDITAVSLH